MAKIGESVIDAHNERVMKLEEFIRVEVKKRETLTRQLARIDELIALTQTQVECDQPLIVEESDGETA